MTILIRAWRSAFRALRRPRARCLSAHLLLAVSLSPSATVAAAGREQEEGITLRQLASDVNSAEPKVRRAALKTLATMGPEALDPVSLLVADPVRDIRHDAILAVVRIYVEPPPKRRVTSAEEAFLWSPHLATPYAVPPVLVTNLVRGLADDWPSERRDATYALGVVLTPPVETGVGDELIYTLADPDHEVRLAAVRALGRLRVTKAGDHLIGHIVDSEPAVRLAAMRAVGDIREARALGALREQLDYYKTDDPGRAALDALARIAHPSSAGLIEQERVSRNHASRRIAYEGIARLGGIRDADAVAEEQRLAAERDREVGLAMAFALAAAGRPYLDRVVQAVADPELADQAMEYLLELGRAKPGILVPHLFDRDPVVRARVAIATGLIGGPHGEPELTRLTTDGDPSVRRAAEVALLRLSPAKRSTSAR